MSEQKEYRVVHELGPQYVSPAYFLDLWQAQQMVKSQKQLAEKIGMGHTADGWHIESRPIAHWKKVEATDG